MTSQTKAELSLYVHAPFCSSRCRYCNFYSGEELSGVEEYPSLIGKEVALRAAMLGPAVARTLYVGGGTPSLLGDKGLGELIGIVAESIPLAPGAEVTAEVNPGSPLDWRELKARGATRVSVGVQALGESELELLGRRHDAISALEAVRSAVASGLKVSADLIYGYEGCDPSSLSRWAHVLAGEGVGHISAYSLEAKPGGPSPSTEEEEEAQGEALAERLSTLGFVRYEVSNFALPGCESRHNLAYWEGRSYLGLGPGAHSFSAECPPHGRRFWNLPGLAAYREALLSGILPPSGGESPSEEEAALERLILALRRSAHFTTAFFPRGEEFIPHLDLLVDSGDLERLTSGVYFPTPRGILRADGLAAWLHEKVFCRTMG